MTELCKQFPYIFTSRLHNCVHGFLDVYTQGVLSNMYPSENAIINEVVAIYRLLCLSAFYLMFFFVIPNHIYTVSTIYI